MILMSSMFTTTKLGDLLCLYSMCACLIRISLCGQQAIVMFPGRVIEYNWIYIGGILMISLLTICFSILIHFMCNTCITSL